MKPLSAQPPEQFVADFFTTPRPSFTARTIPPT